MAKLLISAVLGFWGFVLIGIAMWLSKQGSIGGTLACLLFSSGYFWFSWNIYRGDGHDISP
jgi:hypothetical protein